jgi:hypothetical protein
VAEFAPSYRLIPATPAGTAKTETPFPVSARITKNSAADPEVMNDFSPSSTQQSPSRRALVSSERMSLP